MPKPSVAKIPEKPRKHPWVSSAITAGESRLSVWPSPDDLKTEVKKTRFLETIAKVGNDPRVSDVKRHPHEVHGVVYVFDIKT